MAASLQLKDLKAVWGDTCHSMWAELLSVHALEVFLHSRFQELPHDVSISQFFYLPAVKGRLNDLTKEKFLERASTYRSAIVTNRLVILSAAFETFFLEFLAAYIENRPKLYDNATSTRTAEGNKLYGDVIKVRGLSQKIRKFAELAPSKIKAIEERLSYLEDVYLLRNVLAHAAGTVDKGVAAALKHVILPVGSRVDITPAELLALAAPIVEIAESLDKKIVPAPIA